MQGIKTLAILAAAAFAADTNGAGVDVSGFHGLGKFVLNSGAATGNANATADVKIQHCDTQGGVYEDAGIEFDQVTSPGGASHQEVMVNVDGLKKFVRAAVDLGGTTPAVVCGVSLVGKKQRE